MTISNDSAGAYLSLLNEDEPQLQYYGLVKLNEIVGQFWAEISDHVEKIEEIAEKSTNDHHKLAALVASKIYFYLQEFKDSLNLALEADDFFNLKEDSEYIKTVINKGIQHYINLRQKNNDSFPSSKFEIRLEALVEGVFNRCIENKEFFNVVGLSIESRRLDILTKVLNNDHSGELFSFVLKQCLEFVNQIDYRNEIMKLLVKIQLERPQIDYSSVCYILASLDDPNLASDILINLALSNENDQLTAYQIAFDIANSVSMEYLSIQKSNIDQKISSLSADSHSSSVESLKTLSNILDGTVSRKILLDAMSVCNAYMHAGTTVDSFLRDNLDWLSRATNWSKFTATAALGVIHRGQSENGMSLLKSYLPIDGVSSSPYSEGGAFFGLGLIYSASGTVEVIDYLNEAISHYQSTTAEILQHGACLGLGLAALGLCRADLYESLKHVLYSDSAIAGEAAGIGIGLLMFGSGNDSVIEDMLQYARETNHEKIIRGLAIGMALVVFGIRDDAEPLINNLCQDEDPILRYAGVLATATAYCASGCNSAIERLLHFAVSDVSDDVRRSSVIGLGFVFLRSPEHLPRMVELLSASYNPHLRYGAALSLGIALAGSGSSSAINILEPLLNDPIDFVRQGAFIAMAMVLMQQNDQTNPKVGKFRSTIFSSISNKHEESLAKIGAVMAQGIIDACGQNATIQMFSKSSGLLNIEACIGVFLMTQFWSWFPLSHFLSLAFTPTAIIAVTKDMKIPKFDLAFSGKKKMFDYYSNPVEAPTEKHVPFSKVVLSFSNKNKKSQAPTSKRSEPSSSKNDKESSAESNNKIMEVEHSSAPQDAMDIDENAESSVKKSTQAKTKRSKSSTPSIQTISNFSRVLPQQLQHISWSPGCRFSPINPGLISGFVVVKDLTPEKPIEYILSTLPDSVDENEEDADKYDMTEPRPFEYPFGRD
ncbi:hypothetical protein BB560_006832 [Smittium megazygosporum]|uniref:26S proteasome regulatory subunit RPN2 n=1 Tax=Smittium megazygosporum TaxID=133381 RepID=A0A2T9Y028_9FUNG|nr:hypothetical protein BB560_006936 [Smittium megazygosporum]PVU86021.1 hypothetical protein BB560_006832 [Smittium megazygosporum]